MGADKKASVTKTAERPPEGAMDFEDVLAAVGSYGKYQKRLVYFFLVPIATTLPFYCMNLIFMLSAPAHFCREPVISSAPGLTAEEKMAIIRPVELDPTGVMAPSSCKMHALNYSTILHSIEDSGMNITEYVAHYSKTWQAEACRNGWEYDRSLYARTVTTDWDLVCDHSYLPSLVYTMNTAGSAIGTPIFGSLSDKIGRKITFFVTCVIALVTGVLTIAIPNFIGFIVVRAVNGALLPSVFQLPYLILVEIVSPEMRTRMNGIACIGWTMGMALMSLVGWLTADWIWFGLFCAIISAPYVAYYWILPESPRWLMSQNRFEDAAKIMKKMAKVNKKDISSLDLVVILEKFSQQEQEKSKGDRQVSPLELFRNPTIRRRFCYVSMSWIADSMTYYGFHINIASLYGNEFLNFFLLSIVELPSYMLTWYLIETKLGRRWCNVMFLFLTSIACIVAAAAPESSTTLVTVACLVGKFGVAASFMVMYQQAAEIFPTPLRASGMGIAGTMAAIISICTPYIIYLNKYGRHIPYTFMSCISLAAGICAIFMPETVNCILPQTIHDGETFGLDKPFFSFADTKKPEPRMDLNKLAKEAAQAAPLNSVA